LRVESRLPARHHARHASKARQAGKATPTGDRVPVKAEDFKPLQKRLDLGNSLFKFGSFLRGRKSSISDYRFCKEVNKEVFV
jgi:hypothetical protein